MIPSRRRIIVVVLTTGIATCVLQTRPGRTPDWRGRVMRRIIVNLPVLSTSDRLTDKKKTLLKRSAAKYLLPSSNLVHKRQQLLVC